MNRSIRRALCFLAAASAALPSALRADLIPSSDTGEEVYRINCGTTTDLVLNGKLWMKDEPFEGLYRWGYFGGQPAENLDVHLGDLEEVYRSHRFGRNVRYRIEVPPGGYKIKLLFCETYWDAEGQRVFSVKVNGSVVQDKLDVWKAAGGKNKPYSIEVNLPIYNTGIDIECFQADTDPDNAMISGIEITNTAFYPREFLKWMSKKMFWYFWNEVDPTTGLVSDTAFSFKEGHSRKAHIGATGFGLSIYTVAAANGWITAQEAHDRIVKVLNVFESQTPNVHGFFYRFLNGPDAARWVDGADRSEISTVDSSLFILGAIQAGEYFRDTYPDIADQADRLYRRMDWTAFTGHTGDGFRDTFLSMGWTDESGFLPAVWDGYSESMFIYPLAFGSPTHAISTAAWNNLNRGWETRQGIDYMHGFGAAPLFYQQFHHLYFDMRGVHNDFVDEGLHDDFGDYSKNSLLATEVNRLTCINDPQQRYDENRWGLTAAYGQDDLYHVHGVDDHDGTVAPAAAGAYIGLTHYHSANYENTLAALRHMYFQYKSAIWGRHGFTDSFRVRPNPGVSNITLGINNGPLVIALANQLTELQPLTVTESFMKNPHMQRGMNLLGLRPYTEPYAFASSILNGNQARYAVDGTLATRWESAWADPQFLAMDFLAPKKVNRVTIQWETAHAKSYGIQYSNDGARWTEVFTMPAGDGGEDIADFPAVTARYFRIFCRQRGGVNGNVWGYSILEARFENVLGALPVAPSGLAPTGHAVDRIEWAWQDNAANETGYRLYGATSPAGPFSLKADLPAETTHFTETGLVPGRTYYRTVAAVNDAGEASSAMASETTDAVFTSFGPLAADGTIRSVMDEAGQLHVTFYDPSQQGLRYALWNGTAWTAGEMIDPTASGVPTGDGRIYLSVQDLAIDALGRPQVVYYSGDGNIRWALKEKGAWRNEVVAGVAPSVVVHLAVDPSGIPHVVWSVSGGETELRYGRRTSAGWVIETVAGGVAANTSHLALDETGRVHVAFGSIGDSHALFYTVRDAAGWSAPEQADSIEEWRYRVEPTLLMDGSGQPRILDCLNNRDGRVRYSARTAAGWTSEYAHSDSPDWDHTDTPSPGFALDGAGVAHALYVLHYNYNPPLTRTVYGIRSETGWAETTLAEDERWSAPASLTLDALGRSHLVTLSTDGRIRLIRLETGAAPPLGGGPNSRVQAPTGLTGVFASGTVTWTWTDRASNETAYRLYGSTSAQGPFALLANLPANASSVKETGLLAGKTYFRYVAASNAGGAVPSAQATVSGKVPAAPSQLSLAARTPDSLRWSWRDNATNETGYRLRRTADNAVLVDNLPANTVTWTQSGLGINTSQQVRVEAFNGAGTAVSPNSAVFYTLANPPTGTALSKLNGTLTLSWSANGNPANTLYGVYQSVKNGVFSRVYFGSNLSTPLYGIASRGSYAFKVRSQNGNGVVTAFDATISTGPTTSRWAALPLNETSDSPSFAPAALPTFSPPPGGWTEKTAVYLDPVEEALPPTPSPWRSAGIWRISGEDGDGTPFTVAANRGSDLLRSVVAALDEGTGQWRVLGPSAEVPKPSTVALLQAPPATPQTVRVYPNPFRPGTGQASVTIGGVPEGTLVKIHSVAGDLVRQLEPAAANGTTAWDGRNASGQTVSSGVYFGVAEKDGDRRTFRLTLIQ